MAPNLHVSLKTEIYLDFQICPGLNANEIQIPYDKNHKVSSLVKSYQKHTLVCQTWSNMKISNNSTKFILRSDDCYADRLKKLNLLSLEKRRLLADLTFFI